MSYVGFEDTPTGIHAITYDVTDPGPLPTTADFAEVDLGTLDRASSHLVRFSIDFADGPDNDVVKIYIDGTLVHTGPSWEDYYRYDSEQSPGGNEVPTVDSLLFRAGGAAAPATAGNGYLIDAVRVETSNPAANQGPPGSPGTPGDPGDPGTPGAPGANGTNGTNGTNGANGTNGSAGDQGPAGQGVVQAVREITPVVVLTRSVKPDSRGRAKLKLSCPQAASLCDGHVRIQLSGRIVGRSDFDLLGGSTTSVFVKLSRSTLNKLAKKSLKMQAVVFSRDAQGAASQTSGDLTLKKRAAPKKKKK
jgi:hypothetical protein